MDIDRLRQIIMTAPALHHVPAADRVTAYQALPETARLGIVRGAEVLPDGLRGVIPSAPARGPMRLFEMLAAYPDGKHGTILKPAGFQGRKTAQLLDVFGRMDRQSRRKGGVGLLNASHVGMGRMYASLVQDHAASGLRASSLEALSGGGGSREGFTDHRLAQADRIRLLQARIGTGTAMAIRRVRPSARGDDPASRRNIPDRALVDMVCLDDRDVSDVLRSYGWSTYGETVKAATKALAAALDRMIGPRPRSNIQVIHFGPPPVSPFDDG